MGDITIAIHVQYLLEALTLWIPLANAWIRNSTVRNSTCLLYIWLIYIYIDNNYNYNYSNDSILYILHTYKYKCIYIYVPTSYTPHISILWAQAAGGRLSSWRCGAPRVPGHSQRPGPWSWGPSPTCQPPPDIWHRVNRGLQGGAPVR